LNQKTIIMVTHDIEEAFELGDRICLMDGGSIQQIGTPAALLFHPANAFVLQFFGAERLLLELKALRIEDIWDNLDLVSASEVALEASYADRKTHAAENLWTVVQGLSVAENQSVAVE